MNGHFLNESKEEKIERLQNQLRELDGGEMKEVFHGLLADLEMARDGMRDDKKYRVADSFDRALVTLEIFLESFSKIK